MSTARLKAILNGPDPPERSAVVPERSLTGNLNEAGGKLWDALAPVVSHGNAELAAALFTGAAHVMYGHGGQQDQQQPEATHGLANEVVQPEQEQSQGRE